MTVKVITEGEAIHTPSLPEVIVMRFCCTSHHLHLVSILCLPSQPIPGQNLPPTHSTGFVRYATNISVLHLSYSLNSIAFHRAPWTSPRPNGQRVVSSPLHMIPRNAFASSKTLSISHLRNSSILLVQNLQREGLNPAEGITPASLASPPTSDG